MGERTGLQEALFYEFSLEPHVITGHLVRAIDRFVYHPASGRSSSLLQRDPDGPASNRS